MKKGIKEIESYMAEVASLMAYEDYSKFLPNFVMTLRLSRLPFLKRYPLFVNAIQIGMVKTLSKLQAAIQEGKKRLRVEVNEQEKRSLQKGLTIKRELVRVWQTIADGIAWRALKFNRPLLRLLSDKQPAGAIPADYVSVYEKYLRRCRRVLLVNDLTRYLRIGDLTLVYPDGDPWLYEIKQYGDKLKDVETVLTEMKNHHRRFSRQELRLFVAQMTAIEQKISVPIYGVNGVKNDIKAEIINFDFKIKTHYRAIKRLIRKAARKGFASQLVEAGYYIVVSDMEVLVKDAMARDRWKKERMLGMAKTGQNILRISTYDSFHQEEGHFVRNWTPYSILPFRARDCVRMMMGSIEISIFYDLDVLKEKIIDLGWSVEERDIKGVAKKNKIILQSKEKTSSDFFDSKLDEALWFLRRQDDTGDSFIQPLLITYVMMMLSAFYSTDVILKTLHYEYERAKEDKRARVITINLLGERRVLS